LEDKIAWGRKYEAKVSHMIKKVLLIIDMQKGSFTKETPRHNSAKVCERINSVAEYFRKNEFPVIHIQHDGSKTNQFFPNSHEWEIINEIKVSPNDLLVSKTANDAFYDSTLKRTLEDLGIQEVYISGCATDFCVNATLQSALTNDFTVRVLSDYHTTADRLDLKAVQVIQLFNHIWSNLTPTLGEVTVEESDSLLLKSVEI
jgi:nicotinamidase-related amidase